VKNPSAKLSGSSVLLGKFTRRNSMRFFSMALLIGLFADAIVESRPMPATDIVGIDASSCCNPARWAMKIDPMVLMRYE
jgi:hypothetical protein